MVRPAPHVDPQELDAFLASAPESLKEWAEAQREQVGPGIDDLEDDDILPVKEPAAKPPEQPLASRINKVLVALLAAAVVLLVQQWGRSTPTDQSASPAAPSMQVSQEFDELDQEQVGKLEEQAAANPKDPEPLRQLATLHQDAGLWQEANDYRVKVLELVPDDFDALLATGVFYFNTDKLAEAEEMWQAAVKVNPAKPEGHFNLGFVYLAKKPAEPDRARAAWEKVLEVAPDSELANTARSHLERIGDEP